MEKLTKRQKQSIETKQNIINTFFELLKDKTLEEIKISEICNKAGISIGAFYHHYDSKEEVLSECFHKFDHFTEDKLKNKQYDTTFEAIIDLLYYEIIGSEEFGVNATREIIKATMNPKFYNYFSDDERPSHKRLLSLLQQSKDKEYIDQDINIKDAAVLLQRHAHGISYDWVVQNGSYDIGEVLHYELTIVLKSFKKN